MKEKMLEIIEEAKTIDVMSPQDLRKYLIENHEFFDPEKFDEIKNPYLYKCGILAAKLSTLKSYIEEM